MAKTREKEYENLVQSFMDAVCGDELPYSRAVEVLNQHLDQNYQQLKLYAWRSGTRSVPAEVQHFMREYCLAQEIKRAGGKPPKDYEDIKALNRRISAPNRPHATVERAKKRHRESSRQLTDADYAKGPYSRTMIHQLRDAVNAYLAEHGYSAAEFQRQRGLPVYALTYLRHHDERVENHVPTVSVQILEDIAKGIGFPLKADLDDSSKEKKRTKDTVADD